jgi:hypothetical protein
MHLTSKVLFELVKEPRNARFFAVVSLAGCKPCAALHNDLEAGALEGLDVVLHSVQTDLSNEDDLALVNLLQSGEFPLLALIDDGKIARRWAGYFNLEPIERRAAFRALIAAAWGVAP